MKKYVILVIILCILLLTACNNIMDLADIPEGGLSEVIDDIRHIDTGYNEDSQFRQTSWKKGVTLEDIINSNSVQAVKVAVDKIFILDGEWSELRVGVNNHINYTIHTGIPECGISENSISKNSISENSIPENSISENGISETEVTDEKLYAYFNWLIEDRADILKNLYTAIQEEGEVKNLKLHIDVMYKDSDKYIIDDLWLSDIFFEKWVDKRLATIISQRRDMREYQFGNIEKRGEIL